MNLKKGESIFTKPVEGEMAEFWEQKFVQGHGTSYGPEIFWQKNIAKLTAGFHIPLHGLIEHSLKSIITEHSLTNTIDGTTSALLQCMTSMKM